MKNFYLKTKNLITKNRKNKIIAGIVLLLLLFLILKPIFAKISGGDAEELSENQVVSLKKGDLTNSVSEKGKLVPSNSVEVFSEKTLPVTEVNVKVGDKVKKGDVIAKLDSSSLEQQLKARKAQKEATDKNVSAQVSAAKKRLSEAVTGKKTGKNSAIVAAETSLTQAMDQYLAAQKSYDDFKRSIDERYNQGIVAERNTRENLAYQEEATDLKYKQLQEDIDNNRNKVAENRALSINSSRQKNYLQNQLDDEKRRMTEISIAIKEEQGKLAEAQEKVTGLQTEITSLGAEKDQLTLQKAKANNDPNEIARIEKRMIEIPGEIAKKQNDLKAINFDEIKKEANENVNRLTRNQNELEIEVNRISEELANAKADEQKYLSEAEALEKELEGQRKQVDSTKLEVEKAKEDIYADADKVLKTQKSRDDELKTLAQNLDTAKNNYENAKKNLESTKVQVDNEISGLSDNLKSAKASANNLDSVEIENLTEELEKVLIKAPADGTITEVNAKEGQVPTAALAKIETVESLRIESQIKEYDKNSIKVGSQVEITSDSIVGEVYKGKVISIDPVPMETPQENKTGEVLYKTVIEIEEGQEEKFSSGMSLRVKYIISQEKETFKVPTEAIFDRDGKSYVLALKDAGKDNYQIEKVEVTRGLENDAETAIKSKDLKEGSKVLATSAGYGEGSKVKITKNLGDKEKDKNDQ